MAKIDEVHATVKRMEEKFQKLEEDQQQHFQTALENAAATILAEFKKELGKLTQQIADCKCNEEILKELRKEKPEKKKEAVPEKDKAIVKPGKGKARKGWYPEDLSPSDFPLQPAKWE